jgi:hypothetical protein
LRDGRDLQLVPGDTPALRIAGLEAAVDEQLFSGRARNEHDEDERDSGSNNGQADSWHGRLRGEIAAILHMCERNVKRSFPSLTAHRPLATISLQHKTGDDRDK